MIKRVNKIILLTLFLFKTKKEALIVEQITYNEYINGELKEDAKKYSKNNLKYDSIKMYKD